MNRPIRFSMLLLMVLVGATASVKAQEQKSFEQRLNAMDEEYSRKGKELRRSTAPAKDPAERERLFREEKQRKQEFTRRVLALAREEPDSKAAPKALNIVIVTGGRSPEAVAAIEQLRRDWLLEPEIAFVCLQLGVSSIPQAEPLLRDILEKNPDRTARGIACFSLAKYLDHIAGVAKRSAEDERMAKRLEDDYGQEFLEQIKQRRSDALLNEAEPLFERVVQEFADVRMYLAYGSDKTIGPSAEEWLAQRRDLAVGKPAPEIEGKGLDGKTFKLSDYQGKVVVVDFWGSWCAPCLAMLSHERELVKRLEGKPFAFLGVNSDRTEAAARESVSKERITWPNWYDGDNTPNGIADRYRVHSYPSIFILDGNGIIRAKDVRGKSLDEAVEKLLAEIGH